MSRDFEETFASTLYYFTTKETIDKKKPSLIFNLIQWNKQFQCVRLKC